MASPQRDELQAARTEFLDYEDNYRAQSMIYQVLGFDVNVYAERHLYAGESCDLTGPHWALIGQQKDRAVA